MMKTTIYTLLAIALFSLNSCHSEDPEPKVGPFLEPNPQIDISLSRTEESISNKTKEFSLSLIKEAVQNEKVKGKNLLFSPWGVSVALNMLVDGAGGNTATEIYSALSPDGCTAEDLDEFYSRLNYLLSFRDNTIAVTMDYSLWVSNAFNVKSSYIDCFKNSLDFDILVKNFSGSQATQDLYDWCSEKTKGCIKQIGLDFSNCNMTAVNALYFKSYWTEKFSESETKTNIFYGTTNSSYVKIMHKNVFMQYATSDDFTAVCLPYGNEAYSMQLVLPPKGCDMAQAGKQLAEGVLEDLTAHTKKAKVHIELPRFEMANEFSVKDILGVMGVKDAFDASSANFSKLSDGSLSLKDLTQVAFIHVDEDGGAATACKCGATCTCGDTTNLIVSFNRPFFFFIREKSTGLILFMGKVEDL